MTAVLDGSEQVDVAPAGEDRNARSVWVRRWLGRPVLVVAVVAAAARLLLAVASFVLQSGTMIPDEGQYLSLAEVVARAASADVWAPGYGQSLYDATFSFTAPLARVFELLWPSRIFGQLLSVVFGVVTATLAAFLAGRVAGCRAAIAAGLVVALLPSQIVFSAAAIRESMVWAGVAAVGFGLAISTRRSWVGLAGGMAIAACALFVLAGLRDQTLLAAGWALALASVVAPGALRVPRIAVALVLAVAVPSMAGLGFGGRELVARAIPALGSTRTYMSMEADSAFTATTLLPPADEEVAVATTTTTAASGDDSGVASPPTTSAEGAGALGIVTRPAETIVDEDGDVIRLVQGYRGEVYAVEESLSANLSALPRGLVAATIRPFPWEASSGRAELVARAENLVWYVLYGLAAVGLVVGRRRWRLLAYPVLVTGVTLGVSALTQGNVGTAFRHRAQVTWAVAIVVGVAVDELLKRRASRAAALTAEPLV